MRLYRRDTRRRGASMVEAALIVTVFLALVTGTIDLAVGVFRQHVLTQAARQGVRQAAVHGELAPSSWKGGKWGPTTYGPIAANDTDPKAQAIAPYLAGVDPANVQMTMTWPDGNNRVESRVSVTLTTTWTPVMGFVFGNRTITLSASSTMRIAH